MLLVQTYSKELAAIAAVIIAFILNRYLRPKARLYYSVRHAFTFLVEEPLYDASGAKVAEKQTMNTASISVSNSGLDPASDVEIVFNWKPKYLNVWPSRFFEEKTSPDGRYSIILTTLAPNEIFNIEIFCINSALPGVVSVRSNSCLATIRALLPQPIQPKWLVGIASFLAIVGLGSCGYLLALGIQIIAAG